MKEPKSSRPRIQPRILILFLILGIPPLLLAHVLLVTRAENRFREVVGTYFGQTAQQLQSELVHYVEGLQVQVANLASLPEMQEMARRSSQAAPTEASFQEEMRRVDSEWPTLKPETSKLMAEVMNNPTSDFIRQQNRVTAAFREILVSDRYGRLVAATGKTTDYFQADEPWWRMAYLEGKGQRYISDISYDESAGVYSIEIAEPVRDSLSGEVLGIVKGIADSHTMFGMLDNIKFGRDATAVVIRPNGTMVTSPGSSELYPYAGAVLNALAHNRRWVEAPASRPGFFLGLPQTGVKSQIPELDWVLVVEAPYEEVYSPFQNLQSWFLYIALFSVGLVIVLSLLFTWILSKPIIETDPHLERV